MHDHLTTGWADLVDLNKYDEWKMDISKPNFYSIKNAV